MSYLTTLPNGVSFWNISSIKKLYQKNIFKINLFLLLLNKKNWGFKLSTQINTINLLINTLGVFFFPFNIRFVSPKIEFSVHTAYQN